MEIYKYLNKLGVAKKINNSVELSLSIVEELKDDKPKNEEIAKGITSLSSDSIKQGINHLSELVKDPGEQF